MNIQIIIASAFLISKIMLLLERKMWGWLYAMGATILCIQYFYQLQLYIYVGLEVAMLPIMLKGLVNSKSKSLDLVLYTTIFACLGGLIYFTSTGSLTYIEFISSVAFLLATYALTHKEEKIGWTILILGHASMGYILYLKEQHIFFGFQMLSILISIIAIFPKITLKILWMLMFLSFTLFIFPWFVLWMSDMVDDFMHCSWGLMPKQDPKYICPSCASEDSLIMEDCIRCMNCGTKIKDL